MNCDNIADRKALLESFGGLPETTVQNKEWLYMLEEDTRQSLAIEGHFATEEELEAILAGRKSDREILNYFRTAQTVYDQGLQYYRDRTVMLAVAVVRHIHSELFREVDTRRGEFRKSGIQIQGAKVQPPEFDVESHVRAALQLALAYLEMMPILPALARVHTLFESIHPFHDGNGRVGRILLNYLAISKGYPPIVIKGVAPEERRRYYRSLEQADSGFQRGFPDATVDELRGRLEEGHFDALIQILCEGILPRLDRMTAIALEQHEPLLELEALAKALHVQEQTLRQRVHRGTLIAIRRGNKLYSHPRLDLTKKPGRPRG